MPQFKDCSFYGIWQLFNEFHNLQHHQIRLSFLGDKTRFYLINHGSGARICRPKFTDNAVPAFLYHMSTHFAYVIPL